MRKIISLLAVVIALSGCSFIQTAYESYRMARFDNNEYMLANDIRTRANLGARKCGTPEVVAEVDGLWGKTIELRNYSESIPRNKEAVIMTQELAEIVKGLSDRYHGKESVSMSYCTLKFGTIEKNATVIQNALGAKPR